MADYTREELLEQTKFSKEDESLLQTCRHEHTRLGMAYQMAVARLLNRFPRTSTVDDPLEIIEEVLTYVGIQLGIAAHLIKGYSKRQKTISAHQELIRAHLGVDRFTLNASIEQFVFDQACRLEQKHALLAQTKAFLRDRKILEPADSTLIRIIQQQRQRARESIFDRIYGMLPEVSKDALDALLVTTSTSKLQRLKQAPHRASPKALLRLVEKLEMMAEIDVVDLDLSWLNNNFQRTLARFVRRASIDHIRRFADKQRYSMLVCFVRQCYQDTVDDLMVMYDKLINQVYNRSQEELDEYTRGQRRQIKQSMVSFKTIADLILDDTIDDLRAAIFSQIDRHQLAEQSGEVDQWLTGKYSDVFHLVRARHSYIRKFAPALIKHLHLNIEAEASHSLFEAVEVLREMNENGKRKLPEDTSLDFLPKKLRRLVEQTSEGKINKPAWECALLTNLRDQIKSGNLAIKNSKRFARLDDFFMPETRWKEMRNDFFRRNGMPHNREAVAGYLTRQLSSAYDYFLDQVPCNPYAHLNESGWSLKKDQSEIKYDEQELQRLHAHLAAHMRMVKLPQLLIEVDNELHITRHFMTSTEQKQPIPDMVCAVLATIMAHGCNIGPYTMSHLIDGVSYNRIKHISDWLMTEEAQRSALAQVVGAISRLDITQAWVSGKTSSSDGQRFALKRKVLQQSYSSRFNDYALEFYSFIADNYAPFYSMPTECTDRDAPYVLDGLLYNESDLPLEEHYTDTHGYTEINFAAFAMLGRRFSPRIRGMQKQRIYYMDPDRDYGPLSVLIESKDRHIHIDWIVQQWDKMGHFYASIEQGYTTASVALKRLNGFSGKNHFYRANRELGRIFKTDHILRYMSDPLMRSRTRRGLLKSEQLHALARELNYGKRGQLRGRDWLEQRNSCSCLTLILACIIYWQAKEIHRVLHEVPIDFDNALLEHISPITWDNVILYGEYVLDHRLIKL